LAINKGTQKHGSKQQRQHQTTPTSTPKLINANIEQRDSKQRQQKSTSTLSNTVASYNSTK